MSGWAFTIFSFFLHHPAENSNDVLGVGVQCIIDAVWLGVGRAPLVKNTFEGCPRHARTCMLPLFDSCSKTHCLVLFSCSTYTTTSCSRTLWQKGKDKHSTQQSLSNIFFLYAIKWHGYAEFLRNFAHCSLTSYALRVSSKMRKRTPKTTRLAIVLEIIRISADRTDGFSSSKPRNRTLIH